jgi:hypothetical protein
MSVVVVVVVSSVAFVQTQRPLRPSFGILMVSGLVVVVLASG